MNNIAEDRVTIMQSTFAALLSYARREQTICDANAANALKKVQELPDDAFWQDSVKFWQRESENAENTYKKALMEIAIA